MSPRHMESRLQTSDDKQHIMELELELTAAKEKLEKSNSEMEGIEERRARYEEELDRVERPAHSVWDAAQGAREAGW